MASYLLVGLARSGTTWVGTSLGRTPNVRYLNEPDGFRDAFPFRTMMKYGENPMLGAGAHAPDYERLWDGVFTGGARSRSRRGRVAQVAFDRAGTDARRLARAGCGTSPLLRLALHAAQPPVGVTGHEHVLVKSVQCIGALDWIDHRYSPTVIVVFRSILNTVASWHQLDFVRNPREWAVLVEYARREWSVSPPPATAPVIAHRAFVVAVQTAMLRRAADRHPAWTVVQHEALCEDVSARFRSLAATIGLEWSDAADESVRASDQDGSEPFGTKRVSSLQPERWRERLSDDDVNEIRGVTAMFPDDARVRV